MIALESVTRRFGSVAAVDRGDLAVDRGELVALLGPSGCGKTTALRLIAGFDRPDEGVVRVNGEIVAAHDAWTPPERRHVGMVFQDYALFPHLDVKGNIAYGLPRAARRNGRVDDLLELVGLAEMADRYPHELSGGQQQRVALARTLAPEPAVVLLDEPWSSIDHLLRTSMREELSSILRRAGVTVVLVTHDREEAFALADRVALMHEGKIVQVGRPEEIYFSPATRWAAEFAGDADFVPGTLARGVVETALGRFAVLNESGDRGAVEALVRPELVAPVPDPAGADEVVERSFRGHDVFYRLRLADGRVLCAQRPSDEVVGVGDRVRVTVHQRAVAVFN
jgi:iron(III) transport system ATP-binding protein